jgi:hypothetical protein
MRSKSSTKTRRNAHLMNQHYAQYLWAACNRHDNCLLNRQRAGFDVSPLDFLTFWVQTGSGAHPASCTMGAGCPFPGGKARPGRDADHSPPSSAEVEWVGAVLLSHQAPPWRVAGLLCFFCSPRFSFSSTAGTRVQGCPRQGNASLYKYRPQNASIFTFICRS